MKRIPVLAFLLALAPLTWAEEIVQEAEVVPPTEATDVSAVNVTEPEAPAADGSPDASTVTPVAAETATQSTVTPVAIESAGPASATSVTESVVTPAANPVGAAGESHTVVKGDTLWDLAGSYLKDPFQWTKIYDANRDKIQNPRLIFPSQEFVIPSREAADRLVSVPEEEVPAESPAAVESPAPESEAPVAVAEPVAAPVDEIETVTEASAQAEDMDAEGAPAKKMIEPVDEIVAEAPEPVDDKVQDEREARKKKSMAVPGAGFMGGASDSFLADENWEYDGYVLRDRDQRMMISQGDVVFLNIGAASGVKPKMSAHVYRVGKKVKDPYLKKKSGRMVKRVGTVIVTGQITDEGCTAVVTNSLEPIRIGDIVKFVAR